MNNIESPIGARVVINGAETDYFCGCGYFALQSRPEVIEAACMAVRQYGVNFSTSRFGGLGFPFIEEVESAAARFLGTENAITFPSGYMGCFIMLESLSDDYDVSFVDERSYFSTHSAIAAAGKPSFTFKHLNAQDLAEKVREHLPPGARPLLMCDGVFPDSGAISPIPDYLAVMKDHQEVIICVDDAHATGTIGPNGRGVYDYFGLTGARLYYCSTLSKAVGGYGGVIAGPKDWIDTVKDRSFVLKGSTPLATPAVAATAKALEILEQNPQYRQVLQENVTYAKEAVRSLGFELSDSPAPIISFPCEGYELGQLKQYLLQKTIAIGGRSAQGRSFCPTPKHDTARIAIFSTHTHTQFDRLVHEIGKFLESL